MKIKLFSYGERNNPGAESVVFLDNVETSSKLDGITGVPETFVIDRKAVIINKNYRPSEWNTLEVLRSFNKPCSQTG